MGALAAGAAALAMIAGVDRAATGAFALMHPSAEHNGVALAEVAASVRAELHFPEYAGLPSQEAVGLTVLEAPRGTTVRWFVKPRFEVLEAHLNAADQNVTLHRTDDGWLTGEFVVRENGEIELLVVDGDGSQLRDATQRRIRVVPDTAPQVLIRKPDRDVEIEISDSLSIEYEASDDIGLTETRFVVQTFGGDRTERVLDEMLSMQHHVSEFSLTPADFGVRPGDTLTVWIEAEDGDTVSGPNVGRSEERYVVVASEASRRAQVLASLTEVLDLSITALADRLEEPLPADDADPAIRARFESVGRSARNLVEALAGLANRADHEGTHGLAGHALDPAILRAMHRRLARQVAAEARLYGTRLGSARHRESNEETLVTALEDLALRLSDLLNRSRLDDAASIAQALDELRREMNSLLAELRRAESQAAREALLTALHRARARIRELNARLAAMGESVPQEFLNREAFPAAEESASALDALEQALNNGDLDSAERELLNFQREIDALAKSLGGASQSYAETHFGPRERAMAEALDLLAGLESEQRQLSLSSERVRREAAEAALSTASDTVRAAAQRLSSRADDAMSALRQVKPDALGPVDQEALERATQRLADTVDALRSGDLGEARAMAREAAADVDALSRDLQLSALMFPGRDHQVSNAANVTEAAARSVSELQAALDRAIPNLSQHISPSASAELRESTGRQRATSQAANALGERFASEPDGAPLSPEGAEAMGRAHEQMQEAERALEGRDPVEASRAQQEAARELTELRERLEQQSQQQQSNGQGGGSGSRDPRERVSIPQQSQPTDRSIRRRLLDAMRQQTPEGYEEAVQRYYEEWLR